MENRSKNMKKEYTIVYGEWHTRGSIRYSITKFDRAYTDNLKKLLSEDKYGNVWFVFRGWPLQEGEDKLNVGDIIKLPKSDTQDVIHKQIDEMRTDTKITQKELISSFPY